MADMLTIHRRGGFAGLHQRAQVTDADQCATILHELASVQPGAKHNPVRDGFVYTFHLDTGTGDASAQAERNIPEHQLTPTLRALLHTFTFGA